LPELHPAGWRILADRMGLSRPGLN
jgi:hypothetical protein